MRCVKGITDCTYLSSCGFLAFHEWRRKLSIMLLLITERFVQAARMLGATDRLLLLTTTLDYSFTHTCLNFCLVSQHLFEAKEIIYFRTTRPIPLRGQSESWWRDPCSTSYKDFLFLVGYTQIALFERTLCDNLCANTNNILARRTVVQ